MPRRHARRLEEGDQIALLQWATLVHLTLPAASLRFDDGDDGFRQLSELLIHCPNGGGRSKAEAGRLKAMGVKAGVPDVQLPMRCGPYLGGWWELKQGRNDSSKKQAAFHIELRKLGHYVAICWGWEECARDILNYLRLGPVQINSVPILRTN